MTGRGSALTVGRLHYDGGGDWYANPSSLPNLLRAIRERTSLQTTDRERVVRLTDPSLSAVPYLYMTGHGNVLFSPEDARLLRRHLEQGGFLHADDNYGMDVSFRREIAKVFPDRPLADVPADHPVYHLVYDFPNGPPKIHEHDGLRPRGSASSSVGGWRSTIPTRRTSGTAGRTPRCTTIRNRCGSRPCGWE